VKRAAPDPAEPGEALAAVPAHPVLAAARSVGIQRRTGRTKPVVLVCGQRLPNRPLSGWHPNPAETAAGACGSAQQVGRRHLAEVQAKISELRSLEKALAELVADCAGGHRDCPMLDAL